MLPLRLSRSSELPSKAQLTLGWGGHWREQGVRRRPGCQGGRGPWTPRASKRKFHPLSTTHCKVGLQLHGWHPRIFPLGGREWGSIPDQLVPPQSPAWLNLREAVPCGGGAQGLRAQDPLVSLGTLAGTHLCHICAISGQDGDGGGLGALAYLACVHGPISRAGCSVT